MWSSWYSAKNHRQSEGKLKIVFRLTTILGQRVYMYNSLKANVVK